MAVRRLTDREFSRLFARYQEAGREYRNLNRRVSASNPRYAEVIRLERRYHRLEDQVRAQARRRRTRAAGDVGRGRRHHHRTAGAPTFAQERAISRKIRLLRREGYPEKQAIAIAYRYAGVPPRRARRR